MTTGEKIEKRRLELKLSAEALGKRVGVDKSTIRRYEKKEIKKIPSKYLRTIALELGLNYDDLVDEEDEQNRDNKPLYCDLLRDGTIDVLQDIFAQTTKKARPSEWDGLDAELLKRLLSLTPEEIEKVDAFVQGLLAAR